jgi:hypothetical protein
MLFVVVEETDMGAGETAFSVIKGEVEAVAIGESNGVIGLRASIITEEG